MKFILVWWYAFWAMTGILHKNFAPRVPARQEMATAVSQGSILAKPKTRSPVWEHFGLEANEKGWPAKSDKAVCWLCKKLIVTKGGNTSNLQAHLKNHHPLVFSGLQSSYTDQKILPIPD